MDCFDLQPSVPENIKQMANGIRWLMISDVPCLLLEKRKEPPGEIIMDAILSGAIISIYSRKPYSFSYSVKKGNVEREGGAVPTRQCKKSLYKVKKIGIRILFSGHGTKSL